MYLTWYFFQALRESVIFCEVLFFLRTNWLAMEVWCFRYFCSQVTGFSSRFPKREKTTAEKTAHHQTWNWEIACAFPSRWEGEPGAAWFRIQPSMKIFHIHSYPTTHRTHVWYIYLYILPQKSPILNIPWILWVMIHELGLLNSQILGFQVMVFRVFLL